MVGAALGIGLSFMIFIQGKKVPLKTFFNVTSVILIFVAAGMFTYGVHELESARVIPFYGGEVIENDNSLVAKRMNGDTKIFTFDSSSDNIDDVSYKASKCA